MRLLGVCVAGEWYPRVEVFEGGRGEGGAGRQA